MFLLLLTYFQWLLYFDNQSNEIDICSSVTQICLKGHSSKTMTMFKLMFVFSIHINSSQYINRLYHFCSYLKALFLSLTLKWYYWILPIYRVYLLLVTWKAIHSLTSAGLSPKFGSEWIEIIWNFQSWIPSSLLYQNQWKGQRDCWG